jgi:hypothetical protein
MTVDSSNVECYVLLLHCPSSPPAACTLAPSCQEYQRTLAGSFSPLKLQVFCAELFEVLEILYTVFHLRE